MGKSSINDVGAHDCRQLRQSSEGLREKKHPMGRYDMVQPVDKIFRSQMISYPE